MEKNILALVFFSSKQRERDERETRERGERDERERRERERRAASVGVVALSLSGGIEGVGRWLPRRVKCVFLCFWFCFCGLS